jgi:hypothetical protein
MVKEGELNVTSSRDHCLVDDPCVAELFHVVTSFLMRDGSFLVNNGRLLVWLISMMKCHGVCGRHWVETLLYYTSLLSAHVRI